jgi:hypothetical protein
MLRIVLASRVPLKHEGFCCFVPVSFAVFSLPTVCKSHSACRLQPQLHSDAARAEGDERDVDEHFDHSTEASVDQHFTHFQCSAIDPVTAV